MPFGSAPSGKGPAYVIRSRRAPGRLNHFCRFNWRAFDLSQWSSGLPLSLDGMKPSPVAPRPNKKGPATKPEGLGGSAADHRGVRRCPAGDHQKATPGSLNKVISVDGSREPIEGEICGKGHQGAGEGQRRQPKHEIALYKIEHGSQSPCGPRSHNAEGAVRFRIITSARNDSEAALIDEKAKPAAACGSGALV